MADKFGMMSEAYFKGKRELLEWITDFLKIDVPKVEFLCSGAHYCQLLDAMFPEKMKMSKVNFGARTEPEYVKNWKLVQVVFNDQGIQKLIPVERLVKGRFQDNLEFLQWFYQYFMSVYHGGNDYDPEGRRKRSKGCAGISRAPARKRQKPHAASRNVPSRTNRTKLAPAKRGPGSRSGSVSSAANPELERKLKESRENLEDTQNRFAALQKDHETLESERKDLENIARDIEKERDFYFSKVLEVEKLCKSLPDANEEHVKQILKILYANEEDSPRQRLGGDDDSGKEVPNDVDMDGKETGVAPSTE